MVRYCKDGVLGRKLRESNSLKISVSFPNDTEVGTTARSGLDIGPSRKLDEMVSGSWFVRLAMKPNRLISIVALDFNGPGYVHATLDAEKSDPSRCRDFILE
jgi:hypothetical protein